MDFCKLKEIELNQNVYLIILWVINKCKTRGFCCRFKDRKLLQMIFLQDYIFRIAIYPIGIVTKFHVDSYATELKIGKKPNENANHTLKAISSWNGWKRLLILWIVLKSFHYSLSMHRIEQSYNCSLNCLNADKLNIMASVLA